ncbi:glycosyltransferase family protein [Paraburkholderia dilworthii]|uniref:Glycosyl transferases group 1 n=1 Tax=Paraburkholderia dilworthii TaxID=948106 RepID=A0ABW9DCE6_9BURK
MNAADGPVTSHREGEFEAAAGSTEYCDLLIIDDVLPCDFSPFRNLEYSHYLKHFDSSLLLSTEGWHGAYSNHSFAGQLAASSLAESVKQKVRPFAAFPSIVPKLAYITFLNNAWQMYPYLVDRNIPFVLQLYPGGGFEIGSEECDRRLRTLAKSALCRKIVVTQNLSRNYLLDHIGCDPLKLEFVYGGVYDTNTGFDFSRDKKIYRRDKPTLDICFVAHRYGDDVTKKGSDQFIDIAKALTREFDDVRFHVVGDYTPDQIPLGNAAERIEFHGKQPGEFFREFYPAMDIILSINRQSADGAGTFDGFPTGACMEAGFRGMLNCISDPLDMNVAFIDGVDVMLADLDTPKTVGRLTSMLRDTDRLYTIARANWFKFIQVFDTNQQLWDRTRVVTGELLQHDALIVRPPARMSSMDRSMLPEHKELLRQTKANLDDAVVRHDNLLDEYLKLAAGFDQLKEENVRLAAVVHEPLVEPTPSGRAERVLLRAIRSRYSMQIRSLTARLLRRTNKL